MNGKEAEPNVRVSISTGPADNSLKAVSTSVAEDVVSASERSISLRVNISQQSTQEGEPMETVPWGYSVPSPQQEAVAWDLQQSCPGATNPPSWEQ